MSKFGELLTAFLSFMVLVLFIALALGAPVMLLWNAVMPVVFGLTKITFWQAIGLNLLGSILFGRINVGGSDK